MKRRLVLPMTIFALALANSWAALNPMILSVDLGIDGVLEAAEESPGGFLCLSGAVKTVTLSCSLSGTGSGTVRLAWDHPEKIEVKKPDGTILAPHAVGAGWSTDAMPPTLYVRGIKASDTTNDVTMTLEAHHTSGYVSDSVKFTVLRVDSISVSAPDMCSIKKKAISITAKATCGGNPASGVTVTFSSSDLTFPSGNTAMTDASGVATVTADAGSTPSSCLDGSSVTASADNGVGTLVTGNDQFSIVRINDPTPANPKILDGHYPDNSLYTVVLTNAVTPAIAGVPLTYEFKFGSGESNGVDYPATIEDASSTTDSSGSATVRVRSSDLRQTATVKCIYQESYGSTGVTFEGITGCTTQE